MTIPTREEALRDLDKLSSDYDLAGGWSPDPMPLLATLRSYIESHTGEPVAWRCKTLMADQSWCIDYTGSKEEADECAEYHKNIVEPLYASPVQPDHIAEVGKMIDPLSIGDK